MSGSQDQSHDDQKRYQQLLQILRDGGPLLTAYSGGVDSTFLAAAAHTALGQQSLAVTAVSPSLAQADRQRARRIAQDRDWRHLEIHTSELDREAYRANDGDRCFHCKTELFERMQEVAVELGWDSIAYGAIPEDQQDHRPGQRAAQLARVRAPLIEAGLTKAAVRRLSRELELETWDLPAGACLSSRIAYHTPVTVEKLAAVEQAEALLHSLGFLACRVRHHDGLARIEVPADRLAELLPHAELVSRRLRALGFLYTTVDLGGLRSGSMNDALSYPQLRVIS